jgi:predicted nucleic acid-binding protein
MKLVLDASVALSWLLEDAGAGQAYAGAVFETLARPSAEAHVPGIWGLEIANVIAKAEDRGVLATVAATPILYDTETNAHALQETLQLARRYRLSSYDASYLELALRISLPLATLDDDLRRAGEKAGVKRVKPGR